MEYVIYMEYDPVEEERLYWNNEWGCVPIEQADRYSEEEKAENCFIPLGAKWEIIE